MKISYIMIVLNGMPFIEFSLKAIYDSAHEIIIVEGAVESCMFMANPDGASKDGTIEFLNSFPDPDNKIKRIRGRWPEKREMQNAALRYVSGDYVWLVDSDEVYRKQDIQKVIQVLEQSGAIARMDFFPYSFWKGFDYTVSHPYLLRDGYGFRRVFKYKPGAVFINHRPIIMFCDGEIDPGRILLASTTMKIGIRFYHYSYVLDNKVLEKVEYRSKRISPKAHGLKRMTWYTECFLKWTLENRKEIEQKYSTWTSVPDAGTERFEGTHPEVMLEYIAKFRKAAEEKAKKE